MFGSMYYRNLDMLMRSFRSMNEGYKKTKEKTSWVTSFYVFLFGIPEIGFQVRGMYFRRAFRLLPQKTLKNVLDVGTGIGCYAAYIGTKCRDAEIVGIDIDRTKLKEAALVCKQQRIQNVTFRHGDITKDQQQKSAYDFLASVDVMEHIRDYQNALRHMSSLLRKGGYLYIHVPQIHQRRILHRFVSWEHHDHVREGYDPVILKKEIESLGFVVLDQRNTFGFFGSLAWELNHLLLSKRMVLAALFYPLLYCLSLLDTVKTNSYGLGISILAKKI